MDLYLVLRKNNFSTGQRNSDKIKDFPKVIFSPVNIVKLSSHDEIFSCHKCEIKFNVDGHFSFYANDIVICF